MPNPNPYAKDLGDRDPLVALRETPERIRSVVAAWSPADFERSYGPGKWTARQILIHLAQSELALGNRARMALSTPNYAAQAFDQDKWISRDDRLSGKEALDAFLGMSIMNRSLFASLSPADRTTALTHPEYGELTVDWIVRQMAGHQIHHLEQIQQIAASDRT